MKPTNFNTPVYVGSGEIITPLGRNLKENIMAIKKGQTAIQSHNVPAFHSEPFMGAIIPEEFIAQERQSDLTRLEQLMLSVSRSISEKYKDVLNDNCGLIISTTKGNIDALEGEGNERYYLTNLAKKVSQKIGLSTNPIVLSNACVSGVMAISVAKRMIQVGRYNHLIIIGADLFSRFVFSGFQSFQAVSNEPCKPYDKNRDGITLGEASAALFVTKDSDLFSSDESYYQVMGDSSINDANHISGPSRTGEGLYRSVENAIREAGISRSEIDFVSSHGTATNYNDEMEAQAFNRSEIESIPTFSLKGYFGHTLGAAGLLETVISLAFADQNEVPVSLGYEEHGVTLPLNVTKEVISKDVKVILKTASGFGGSNTAVIFKKC